MMGLVPLGLVVLAWISYEIYVRWQARVLERRPFPAKWLRILEETLPVYPLLSEQQQTRLQNLVKTFIERKKFYGCGGLALTDDIRVTIAAEACLLLLNRGGRLYPKLQSILVYPTAFQVDRPQARADGTVSVEGHNLLGESWSNGRVILSWDDVTRGVADFSDGHNVVFHEFAHQLDAESGVTNGAPPLRQNSYRAWAAVFTDNFKDLVQRRNRGRSTVMDTYGATSPAEFFAVATETFFEKPHQLHKRRPQLYQELQAYYQVDPRDWSKNS